MIVFRPVGRVSQRRLEFRAEEATVDAHGDSEQAKAFRLGIADNLRLPFSTNILGVNVMAGKIHVTERAKSFRSAKQGVTSQTRVGAPAGRQRSNGLEK